MKKSSCSVGGWPRGASWPEDRELDYFERTNEMRAGRDWWSLQPVVRPDLPELERQPPPDNPIDTNPIDAFVWAKLESQGISPAPPADRRTLIRRVYYDLIGLPPSEAEIEAFLADDSPDAWPRLIDRLLEMPQDGERWARFWLDLARYADTSGYERDQEKPYAWKYRDWVVDAFQAGGQRIKAMHRLILTSQTWQQSSLHPQAEALERRDSTNRLLWRFARRRLDAEALRDSLLAVSDELNTSMGGEAFKPTISPEALEGLSRKTAAWQASPRQQQNRRPLYMYLKRGLLPPMMTAFDLCDPTLSCGQRDVTIVPTQALAMLNNRFVHDRSERLATIISEQYSSDRQQVRQAWSRVLRRPPSPGELDAALQFLATQTQIFS